MTRTPTNVGKNAGVILLMVLWLCSTAAAAGKVPIRVKGSSDMAKYVDVLAKRYAREHPDVNLVVSGGGTSCGMKGLFDHTVEVVMASLPLSKRQKRLADEHGLQIRERFFGWQGIAVFVHPDNKVSTLTFDELRNIFTGRCSSWIDVMGPDKPLIVYAGEYPFADAYTYFQIYVLKGAQIKKDASMRRYYRNIIKAVASDPYGIGIAPLPKVEEVGREHPVKMIGIKKNKNAAPVIPDKASVEDRSYPLIRPLYLYTDAKSDKKFVSDFVEYCAIHSLVGKWKLPAK